MDYQITELKELSGRKATIYTILPRHSERSLFDDFILKHAESHKNEISELLSRLYNIGTNVGARESFFKHNEGNPGDGVCALYDEDKKLRLYCIRYGAMAIILGGGAKKEVRAWQDDPALKAEAEKIIRYAKHINNRIRNKDDLIWDEDGKHLKGDLKNYT